MKNVQIIEFPKSDLHFIAKWRSDERINRYIRQGIRTLPEVENWYTGYFSKEENELYLINFKDRPAGYFTIEKVDPVNRNCEFGIVIGDMELHQKGIGSFVIKTMLETVFKEMNMHRVFASIHEDNIASINCFLKNGFIFEGKLTEAKLAGDRYFGMCLYSIIGN